jgi:GNAT superfamily N-acetyltransferase
MTIRRATPRDAAALTALAFASKRHWRYSEALMRLWRSDLTVTPAFVAQHQVWCALEGWRSVGFYALSQQGDTCELEHFWVLPRRMRIGTGRRLFAHALELGRSLGARRLEIASDPHAEGFYLRMGARRIGEVVARPAGRTLPLLAIDLDAVVGAR